MPFSIIAPTLIEEEEYIWGELEREDLPEVFDLQQSVNELDDGDNSDTLADLQNQFEDPWSNPRTDGRVIRNVKGKLAAFARVFVNPQPTHENLAFLWSEVAAESRDEGLEEETLEWMESRAIERLAEIAQSPANQDLPRLLRTGFSVRALDRIQVYQSHGYSHVRSFFMMERDLREPIPPNPLPEGLALRVYTEDMAEQVRFALNEAFQDHWGHQDVSVEDWNMFFMGSSESRPDLSLLVMDGAAIAAFSMNRVKHLENERLGIRRGWIGSVGTRRAWRKRGLASALLAESMRRFKAEGFDSVGLGVDAKNLTGALALYERIGFETYKTRAALAKQVA